MGTPLPKGISIEHAIKSCAEAAGWKNKNGKWTFTKPYDDKEKDIVRGIGIAIGYKNVGFSFGAPENCWAGVTIIGKNKIEKVILKHAGADVGQGAHSVFVQLAAGIIGVPIELVELIASDTAETGNSGSASASRMTFMAGNAIIGAAEKALAKWKKTRNARPKRLSFTGRRKPHRMIRKRAHVCRISLMGMLQLRSKLA